MTAVRRALLGPVVTGALLVLLVNDHLLKVQFPGHPLTGKLSDVAGMVFFPIVLAYVLGGTRARHVASAALATAAVFGAIKLSSGACDLYADALGATQWLVRAPSWLARGVALPSPAAAIVARDPTDLLALPFAVLPVLVTARASRPSARAISARRSRSRRLGP